LSRRNPEEEAVRREVGKVAGASCRAEDRGKHAAVVITMDGRARRVFIARTASDHRAARNSARDARRALAHLTAGESAR
jgi:hypothetical protein